MQYDCNLVPINHVILGGDEPIDSLCNDCCSPDCSNPIRDHNLYVLGKPTKMRLWTVNNTVKQVVSCEGYISGSSIVRDSGDN